MAALAAVLLTGLTGLPAASQPVLPRPTQDARPTHRIVVLGDSITKGVRSGVLAEQTFAAVLAAELQQAGCPVKVLNVGIGGERTDQALLRLDRDVLSRKPSVVTVMYGTNDSYVDQGRQDSRLTVDQYRSNLQQLIRQLREAHIQPVLMTPPRWGRTARPNGAGQHPNLQLELYVQACRDVARDTQTPLVDHYREWTEAERAGTDIGTWTTDQCHPNPAGHQRLAASMQPVIHGLLQPAALPQPPGDK